MKRILLALLAIPALSLAADAGNRVAGSGCVDATTIPTAYTSAGSELIANTQSATHLLVRNHSDATIDLCVQAADAASCTDQVTYPANTGDAKDQIRVGGFIRARAAVAATTGIVCVEMW